MVGREWDGEASAGSRGEFPAGCRYRHPLGWYAVSIPPGWKLADDSEPVRILATREEAAAVVAVAKIAGGPPPRASLANVLREVPGLSVIERREPSEGEVRGMRFARVEEVIGQRPPWWAFWRRARAEAHIFTACFTRGSLVALVTFEVAPGRVEMHRLAASALIGSFDLAENPIPAPPEFLARFLVLARERLRGSRIVSTGPLAVTIDGMPLSLEQQYRALACEPELGDDVFGRIFSFLASGEAPGGAASLDEAEPRILFTLKPREWIEASDRQVPEAAQVVRIQLPNDVGLVFVLDHPNVMRFVSREESERWELPPRLMLEVARRNLSRLRSRLTERAVLDPRGRICALVIQEGDGYDASRLFLPGLYEELRERLGDEFLIAIPNRDTLIAFQATDERVVDGIRRRILDDVRRRPYPISDRFFRLTPDGGVEGL